MQKQFINNVNTFLSPYMRGYRKGFSTQYALLPLQRVLMDLSKVFDTLNHEPLISKLDAYEVGKESLMLL